MKPFRTNSSANKAVRVWMAERLREEQDALTEKIIARENVLHYTHGVTWKHPALENSVDGTMEHHTADAELKFADIVQNNVSIVVESLTSVSEKMKAQLMTSMYTLVSETCEKVGNVIDSREIGIAEGFIKVLEAIDFSVDAQGNISLPQIHMNDPAKLVTALKSQPPEFLQRVDDIKKSKIASAIEREMLRKAKFKKGYE